LPHTIYLNILAQSYQNRRHLHQMDVWDIYPL
jgi:hypothetical protein